MHFPTPQELKWALPLDADDAQFISSSRSQAKKVVTGKDERLAILVGPCSIHEIENSLVYAEKLAALSNRVSESCFLVMRVCIEKPRSGQGWKGLLYDPDLDGSHAIEKGLRESRALFLKLTNLKVPIATEFVDPLIAPYFDDLVTWGFIGARTSSSQPHRMLASSLPFPVGFKNGLEGAFDPVVRSIDAAASPHTFLQIDQEGKLGVKTSCGNPLAHLILRGSFSASNYEASFVEEACKELALHGLTPRLLIDCAHGNSQKVHTKQKAVFLDVLSQIEQGNTNIMGMMLESYLYAGNQPHTEEEPMKSGISITDPCLDWLSTEELILEAQERCNEKMIK